MSAEGPADSAEVARLRQRLPGRARRVAVMPGYRESAVLIPLVLSPAQAAAPAILLTLRHADLPTHAGQIAFPGGKRDPTDVDLQHTALREAQEEVGLDPAQVEVLGLLDDVWTPARFVITPVVAVVAGQVELSPAAGEVAEVFYAPLHLLPAAHRPGVLREFQGVPFVMPEYHLEGRRIWGATALMLGQLLELLRGE